MNNLNELRNLAGMELIKENVDESSDTLVDKILQMAESRAYDMGAEQGNVTSDMIMEAVRKILSDLENEIAQKLQGDTPADEMDSTEMEMGADRSMEMGETNFKL